MKKIILSVLLASISGGLFAQLTKGTIAFTGIVGLGSNKQVSETTNAGTITKFEQKTSQFLVLPGVSYFVNDNFEAGVALLIQKNTVVSKNPNFGISETKNENPFNGLGLFGNYYFKKAEKFGMYGGAQLAFGAGTGKVTTTPLNGPTTVVETKNNGSTFGFNLGFLYFVKNNIALNGSLGLLSFNTVKSSTTNNGTTFETKNGSWAFGVNGVVINMGIKVFLSKKSAP